MIEHIYISHTSYCTGWDLDKMLEGTIFKKAARTNSFCWTESEIKMLDWDFRKPNLEKHFEIAKNYEGLEVVMAPDLWLDTDINWLIGVAYKLRRLVPRVLIPIHCAISNEALFDFEFAMPMGVWGNKTACANLMEMQVYKNVKHLLGGSPHGQYETARWFPALKSVDGNQAFFCAVHFGKYWENGKWVKPVKQMTNEQCFRISIKNIERLWKGE